MKLALAFALLATPAVAWDTVFAVNEGQPNCIAVDYNMDGAFRVVRPLQGGVQIGVFFPGQLGSPQLVSALYVQVDNNTPYALNGAIYGGGRVTFTFSKGETKIANALISELSQGRSVAMIWDNGKPISRWPLRGAAQAIQGLNGCLAAGGAGFANRVTIPETPEWPELTPFQRWRLLNDIENIREQWREDDFYDLQNALK